MVVKCNSAKCVSPFQDGRYGKGVRVQNETKTPEKVRCTVCGAENPKKG